MQRQRLRD